MPKRSAVNLDSVESVSLAVLVERIGRLSDDRMRQVCHALSVAIDCPPLTSAGAAVIAVKKENCAYEISGP